ncbi:MAG TPA: hypothetical protein VNC16_01820 [Solirubrobacterales bacterium]|jgi:hypothetical protein|nr:hypothetical protein [Solirubrobacterales bacterium]
MTSEQEGRRPTLNQVGKLLLYDELLVKWTAKEPSRASLFKTVYVCVGRLQSETGWQMEELLHHLGCETEEEEFDEKLTPRRLAMCTEYMEWVEELLKGFDLRFDKRAALKGASQFYDAAGEDLSLVKGIMAEGKTPSFYLWLGEIGQGWKAATRCLDGPEGERARRIHESNPFLSETSPHVSPERLKMLASPQAAELLGLEMAERMRKHVSDCSRCGPYWAELAAQLELGFSGVLR